MKSFHLIIVLIFKLIFLENVNAQDSLNSRKVNNENSLVKTENPADSIVDKEQLKKKTQNAKFHCWFYGDTTFNGKMQRAFIYSISDSALLLAVSATKNAFKSNQWNLSKIYVSDLEKIKIMRKGSVGRGIFYGALSGIFVGGVLGWAGIYEFDESSPLPPGENAVVGAFTFMIPSMVIGGIIGSFRVNIPINKSQQQFQRRKKQIEQYSISKSN